MPQVRIYIQEVIKKNKYIYLEKEKIHYLKNVMRKRTGDNILVFNDDEEWLSKCFFENKSKLSPEKLLRNKENTKDIWICFGLVKTKNINLSLHEAIINKNLLSIDFVKPSRFLKPFYWIKILRRSII